MPTNGEITRNALDKFFKSYGTGVVFLTIGIVLAIIFIVIADLFEEKGLPNRILNKLAEASMFIGGAGLIGTIYIFINDFKNRSLPDKFGSLETVFCKDVGMFKRKVFYEVS